MYVVRRAPDYGRPWNWHRQPEAYAQLIERIEWACQFDTRVDMRALATRPNSTDAFRLAYVHAHVRRFGEEEAAGSRVSFNYAGARFEREIVSVREFLERLQTARIDEIAHKRAPERELGPLRVGDLELVPQTDGDSTASSHAAATKYAMEPCWWWYARLVSYGPIEPLISFSADTPIFQSRFDLLAVLGGMQRFGIGDIRPGGLNIVVSEPRGAIVGVTQDDGKRVAVVLHGPQLERLRFHARWSGHQSSGTFTAMASESVTLPTLHGLVKLYVALVAKGDELVDVACFELIPAPATPEVLELIRQGETARVEFKEWIKLGDPKVHNLECCVVAMANGAEVGTILIGVSDVGELKWANFLYQDVSDGSFTDQLARRKAAVERYGHKLRDGLMIRIAPSPRIELRTVSVGAEVVLWMDVYPSSLLVHDSDERVWVRRNASVRPPNNAEIFAKRGT